MNAARNPVSKTGMSTNQDYNNLKAALLDLGRSNYEGIRANLIADRGYDGFRELQNEVFKEIGTIEFEKHYPATI